MTPPDPQQVAEIAGRLSKAQREAPSATSSKEPTMTTEVILKRCPFDCDPEVDPTVEPTDGKFKGVCNWCGATGPAGATADEAAHAWNERVHHD